jgi:hypothetical protein
MAEEMDQRVHAQSILGRQSASDRPTDPPLPLPIPQVAECDDDKTTQSWLRFRESKPHILVCAPSNVAVDNIILRIIEDGFKDQDGNTYYPSIIRVGRGQSDGVKPVSLDNQVGAGPGEGKMRERGGEREREMLESACAVPWVCQASWIMTKIRLLWRWRTYFIVFLFL